MRYEAQGRWVDDVRFDAIFVALCGWILLGAFTDGWAHSHGRTDETFFTIWHAFLYSGFVAAVVFAGITWTNNRRRGYQGWGLLPPGYELTLAGLGLFALGGLGDMVWHTLFGVEANLEAMYSPTHLLLMIGLLLIVTGPVRAAWRRAQVVPDPPLPLLLALAYTLALLTFLTFFTNVFTMAYPQMAAGAGEELGIGAILLQASLLTGFILFVLRRWQLPMGSFTLIFTLVFTGMAVITDEYRFIPVMTLGGIVADVLNEYWQPGRVVSRRTRWFAFVVPAFLYAAYFLTLFLTGGVAWTIHLWAGGIFLAGMMGTLTSYLLWPPTQPETPDGSGKTSPASPPDS
ncbi:MAG: hypothetical protein H6650_15470 [Ardenticatenales bacterium]|nr:hypothetical protein [Ardenticatenales bacterium]